jgi:hypothetical protein
VALGLESAQDPRTVKAWARQAGMSETQLRLRCRLAGVGAKASLDFTRMLRAAVCHAATGHPLQDYLDIGDTRTLRRLFTWAGLHDGAEVTVSSFLAAQRLISERALWTKSRS